MSKLEVDTIAPQSGTTITVGESGDTVTIPTGVTLDASNATTTLPATVVTTTGSQTLTNKSIDSDNNTITNIVNADIKAGAAIDYSKLNLTGNIALADLSATGTKDATTFLRGDNTFGVPPLGGITEFDQWRLSASVLGTNTPVSSNLERVDTPSTPLIGTGMSQSSGIFTFPSTGMWWIGATAQFYCNGNTSGNMYLRIQVTTDNSTYSTRAEILHGISFDGDSTAPFTSLFLDVTDTTNVKVRFTTEYTNAGDQLQGHTDFNKTNFIFARIGNT